MSYALIFLLHDADAPSIFSNDVLKQLSELEHNHWLKEKIADGWQFATALITMRDPIPLCCLGTNCLKRRKKRIAISSAAFLKSWHVQKDAAHLVLSRAHNFKRNFEAG